MTSSRMASSSRPNSSTENIIGPSSSDFELDVARRGADAELDGSPGLVRDRARAQVADAAGDEPDIAAVADPHPAAVRRVQARVLGEAEQIQPAVARHLDAAAREADA